MVALSAMPDVIDLPIAAIIRSDRRDGRRQAASRNNVRRPRDYRFLAAQERAQRRRGCALRAIWAGRRSVDRLEIGPSMAR